MQPLNYAINEGFKLSWKGAIVGGTIGAFIGHSAAQDMAKKDPSSGILAAVTLVAFPFFGFVSGSVGGFVCGTVKGCADWTINGPFEPHATDDVSVRMGIDLMYGVAQLAFKRENDNDWTDQ